MFTQNDTNDKKILATKQRIGLREKDKDPPLFHSVCNFLERQTSHRRISTTGMIIMFRHGHLSWIGPDWDLGEFLTNTTISSKYKCHNQQSALNIFWQIPQSAQVLTNTSFRQIWNSNKISIIIFLFWWRKKAPKFWINS